jgi:peptidoglycan-associated lipoprotein
MKINEKSLKRFAMVGMLGLVASTTACAHVGQQDFDDGLAALRADLTSEMEAGDAAVAQRLGDRLARTEARLADLERDVVALEQEFGATVERLETALRFNVPVHFEFDDASLNEDARDILTRFGNVAQDYYPEALITVEGFTDPAGDAEYNVWLGQRRADAVRGYLLEEAGFAADRVRAVSYGENTQRLVAAGSGPGQAGWENRRVVLVIDHNGMAPAPAVIAESTK